MILGLTGAFGGGKSTVLHYFEEKGWYTFDADAACHKLYDAAIPELIDKVKELFGNSAVRPDNTIDRGVIAQAAFAHPEKMKLLTGTLYPLLTKNMIDTIARCRSGKRHGIFELPLLYEGGFENHFDAVLALWTDPELRKLRLRNRNYSADDMAKRDARQLPPEEKLERADFAVINNGSPEMLFEQLDKLIELLKNK